MYTPKIISALINAQNEQDAYEYAQCFSSSAVVHDEGRDHTGQNEIEEWIALANAKYRTFIKKLDYQGSADKGVLTVKATGTFDGSPLVMEYHLEFENGLISSLKITA